MSKNKVLPVLAGLAGLGAIGAAIYAAHKKKEGGDMVAPSLANGPDPNKEVLPTNVRPTHYSVELNPGFDFGTVKEDTDYSYEGKVSIQLDVISKTTKITLHAKELDFAAKDCVFSVGGVSVKKVLFHKKDETATLILNGSLPAGSKATLDINFSGVVNDQLHGFYRSVYTKDGEKRVMGTTQFEATHCREAFPCWDEPEIKAVFEIILVVPTNRTALSNMPVVREEVLPGDKKRLTYAPTPIVSSYLLAWVIGEFDYVESKTPDGILVRVYTQEGITSQGEFALDVAVKVLNFFTEFFDIAYPLPKMDMIAIPDFAAGAMENWGLVTYRETALLFDPATSSASSKERVAYVVAHELAHQWFGNLVSPGWWKFLWLNEGFATWAGQLAIAEIFPEWNMWEKFVSSYVANAFKADGLESSHPIEVEVLNASAISEIFDAISYYKGSSVIRMLANYLGLETFRNGLRTYLKDKQYACATTEDLWQHCSAASGKDVARLMDNWVKITGYPYVTIEEMDASAGSPENHVTIKLSQRLFLSTGVDASGEGVGEPTWCCPVNVILGCGSKVVSRKFELSSKTATISLELPAGVKSSDKWWLKVNTDSSSFFRVNYDDSLQNRLVPALATLSSSIDRMGVQNDVFALMQAGVGSTVDALKLAAGYAGETDYSIWSDLTSSLNSLKYLYTAEKCDFVDGYKLYLQKLFKPIAKHVGWVVKDGEAQTLTLLRPMVLSVAGHAGDASIIAECKKKFDAQANGGEEVPVDLRPAVYAIALNDGGEKEYNVLLERYNKTDSQEERVRILTSLAAAPTPELLKKHLDFSLTDKVRSQDTIYCVSSVARNPEGRAIAWAWFKENWGTIIERYGSGQFMLANFLKSVSTGFATKEDLAEIEAFFKGKELPGAERALLQAKESVELHIRMMERDRNSTALKAYLAA